MILAAQLLVLVVLPLEVIRQEVTEAYLRVAQEATEVIRQVEALPEVAAEVTAQAEVLPEVVTAQVEALLEVVHQAEAVAEVLAEETKKKTKSSCFFPINFYL